MGNAERFLHCYRDDILWTEGPSRNSAGTFYVWVPVPRGTNAAALATRCLTEAGVVVTPGNGFGDAGEGYIRLTLCTPVERLREAVERLRTLHL